jgi:hypothetical protein
MATKNRVASYVVLARVRADVWTIHSTHRRLRDAADQADMIRGRVVAIDREGQPVITHTCPACSGDPMSCECDTPWSA